MFQSQTRAFVHSVAQSHTFRWTLNISFYTALFVGLLSNELPTETPSLHPLTNATVRHATNPLQRAQQTTATSLVVPATEVTTTNATLPTDIVGAQERLSPSEQMPHRMTCKLPSQQLATENYVSNHSRYNFAIAIDRKQPDLDQSNPHPVSNTHPVVHRQSNHVLPNAHRPVIRRITYRSRSTGRLYYKYVSVAPASNPRLKSSDSWVDSQQYDDAGENDNELSEAEIRRRVDAGKRKVRALAEANKARQLQEKRRGSSRRRPTINLAQYKAWMASKIGINSLVEHHKSPVSNAPFSMRHVGQNLGLGGGTVEGTGYSRYSAREALAACSYSSYGMPVLYQGVAKGRDGYYAYKIYRH